MDNSSMKLYQERLSKQETENGRLEESLKKNKEDDLKEINLYKEV